MSLDTIDFSRSDNVINALDSAPDRMKYSAIHVWVKHGECLQLVSPAIIAAQRISVHVNQACLVADVFRKRLPQSAYGLGTPSAPILYPGIVPKTAQSWLGYPIAGTGRDGELLGVVSCFDRHASGHRPVLISKLDVPVIDAFSTVLHMAIELQNMHEQKFGRQSIRSHEISLLVSLVQANVDILFDRLTRPGRRLPTLIGTPSVSFAPRTSKTIYENIRTVICTLQSVLTRDRVLSGEWRPDKKSYPLNRMIANSVAMLRTLLRRLTWVTKEVNIDYDEIDRDVQTDQGAFQEVLFNLLMNACKYSFDKSTVRIIDAKNGDLLIVNRGIGIPIGEEEKIFQLGVQGSNAASAHTEFDGPGEQFRDKGIGLYVCREVMLALGGDVIVEQSGGQKQDTIFRIIFSKRVAR